jgi:hypothetical protein
MSQLNLVVTPTEKVLQALGAYYRQAEGLEVNEEELRAWFATLAPQQRHTVALVNPTYWALLPECRRYLLECRGHSLAAYLSSHLTAAELAHWVGQADNIL